MTQLAPARPARPVRVARTAAPAVRVPQVTAEHLDAQLDDLLTRWHSWQHASRVTRGFNERATVTGDYLVSRQYDDANGVLDDDLDDARSKAVDREVQEMLHPWRTAIYLLARNLCTGFDVWASPRLPQDRFECDAIVAVARQQLIRRLQLAGVL